MLRITKAGDAYLRRLLIQGANDILGAHGPDSDLRRFGERLMTRGGRAARKKALVAVARKLAVRGGTLRCRPSPSVQHPSPGSPY